MSKWITELLALHESRGRYLRYLGSFPSYIPSEGESAREDDISSLAWRLGLMLTVDQRNGRRYVFAEPHMWEKNAHRPDVTKLVFGELTAADSAGYEAQRSHRLYESWYQANHEEMSPVLFNVTPDQYSGPCECMKYGCTPWFTERAAAA